MSKEIKLDETSYLMLLNKIFKNKEEERDMALDRYRKADEQMTTNDHFMLLGKNAGMFLRQASDATNDLMTLSKEIKSILFKEGDQGQSGAIASGANDAEMRAIIDMVKEKEEASGITQPIIVKDNEEGEETAE